MTHIPFSRMESYWQYGVGVLLCISQIWCLIFIASTLVLLVFCLLFFRIQFSIPKMDWTPQGPEYGVDSCLRFLVSAIEFCPQLWPNFGYTNSFSFRPTSLPLYRLSNELLNMLLVCPQKWNVQGIFMKVGRVILGWGGATTRSNCLVVSMFREYHE